MWVDGVAKSQTFGEIYKFLFLYFIYYIRLKVQRGIGHLSHFMWNPRIMSHLFLLRMQGKNPTWRGLSMGSMILAHHFVSSSSPGYITVWSKSLPSLKFSWNIPPRTPLLFDIAKIFFVWKISISVLILLRTWKILILKGILKNINIEKILYQKEYGISNTHIE